VSTDSGVNESPRAAALAAGVLDEVERVVIGKRPVLELVLMALLSDGHVLIEDLPGLAKTLMARSFAEVIKLRFARIQFTPDLMPSDVTGASIYDQRTAEFIFRPGPVFANLLLGDEINRAPAKTQAALLEALQEHQVTVEGTTRQLERPFLVIATQNPIEAEGTYPLPEAQLDRFLVRISVGHPERDDEIEILERRAARRTDYVELKEVLDPATLRWMQGVTEAVFVSPSISAYIVDLVSATRSSPLVQVGASPRGSLALMKLARSRATMAGRDFVIPEDVKAVAVPALAHRIMLKPEVWVQRIRTDDLVRRVLETVPTPSADEAELRRS
jgi:MoxR-like ATPase